MKEVENLEKKKVILDIIGFKNYQCEFPNNLMLDYLNLTCDQVLNVELSFKDMPGYFYEEDIAHFGRITVGGGSFGIQMATTMGLFELQPFLRYDRGHKRGLKVDHFNPMLRVVYPSGTSIYLPEKSTKYNIFGKKMPEILRIETDIHYWKAYSLGKTEKVFEGKIKKKFKKKPRARPAEAYV
jgi:hypothetical protein